MRRVWAVCLVAAAIAAGASGAMWLERTVHADRLVLAGSSDEAAIRGVLDAQVADWNRGDVSAFMAGYENSPETTFVGAATIQQGYQTIQERYKRNYLGKEQMGMLTFKDLNVRLLTTAAGVTEYAVVTGRFHLERTAKGEATKDDGIFSLLWHKGPGGWKVILDHTA